MINLREKGLNGFQLKLIGLILMVLDHIYYFFSFKNIPIIFTWLGRIVAPIFVFTAVEGYHYTRSRGKYMLRLYIGFLFMNFGNSLMMAYLPRPDNLSISNNIFSTLFLIVLYISILEIIAKAKEEDNRFKKNLGIGLFITPILLDWIIFLNSKSLTFLNNVIPRISITEGGIVFVLIGIIMYEFRDNRRKQLGIYSFLSLLFVGYQRLMIFAIPLLFLYNGEKGRGMKYLFYVFYPLHIYLLYILSTYILTLGV